MFDMVKFANGLLKSTAERNANRVPLSSIPDSIILSVRDGYCRDCVKVKRCIALCDGLRDECGRMMDEAITELAKIDAEEEARERMVEL